MRDFKNYIIRFLLTFLFLLYCGLNFGQMDSPLDPNKGDPPVIPRPEPIPVWIDGFDDCSTEGYWACATITPET